MDNEQRIIRFSGQVQGVGFRYTACAVARGHAVTGYVRNLPDGPVECVVEGARGDIEAFLAELRQAMGAYLQGVSQKTAPYTGRFASFSVRF